VWSFDRVEKERKVYEFSEMFYEFARVVVILVGWWEWWMEIRRNGVLVF